MLHSGRIKWFACEIRSHSHILNASALTFLARQELMMRAIYMSKDTLRIEVGTPEEFKVTREDALEYAFRVASNFLVALNIAALGHFSWAVGSKLFWLCEYGQDSAQKDGIAILSNDPSFPMERQALREGEVRNATILLGALLRERDQTFRREYLKGIIHIGAGLVDLSFHREAFGNFYKSFEYFVTTRILKRRKLSNELRDLQKGIQSIGLPDNFREEFKGLYLLRSEQIMHAQKTPRKVGRDDVFKMKTFTDYALHQFYRSQADNWFDKWKRGDVSN